MSSKNAVHIKHSDGKIRRRKNFQRNNHLSLLKINLREDYIHLYDSLAGVCQDNIQRRL